MNNDAEFANFANEKINIDNNDIVFESNSDNEEE